MPEKELFLLKVEEDVTVAVEAVPADERVLISTRAGQADTGATLEDHLARVKPLFEKLMATFRDINTPQDVEIEVGLKLSAKAGIIITSLDSEVNFRVKLRWSNPRAQ